MNSNALMLFKGDRIENDKKETLKYFKMRADKGNSNSAFYYAKMFYYRDEIEKKNKKDTIEYFKKIG